MKQRICKRLVAAVMLAAMLLTFSGCELDDLLNFNFGSKEHETAATVPTYLMTLPVETEATEPEETEPEETEPPETEPPVVYYWVKAFGGLNVRRGPGQNYDIVGRLDDGQQIYPLKWENGWAYIEYPYVGWCSGEYLVKDEPEYEAAEGTYWMNTSMNLHEGPSSNYDEACYIEIGMKVRAVEWSGKWVRLEKDGYDIGWCKEEHLSKYDPYPERDASAFLDGHRPTDRSLVDSWLVVSNYNRGADVEAGALELKSDGTFVHWMDYFQHTSGGYWYSPGGYAYRCWVGEYTYDGKTLVLTYMAVEMESRLFEKNGPPIITDLYWKRFEKTVTLQVTACEEGFMVDEPWNIPVDEQTAKGSSSTYATLYRFYDYSGVEDMLRVYFS